MLKKIIILIIIFILITEKAASQYIIDYSFTPAKNELETNLGIVLNDEIIFGIIHNEEKNYFHPYLDSLTLTYPYFLVKVYNHYYLRIAYGFGYRRDIEFMIIYDNGWFVLETGYSETENLFLNISFYFL